MGIQSTHTEREKVGKVKKMCHIPAKGEGYAGTLGSLPVGYNLEVNYTLIEIG